MKDSTWQKYRGAEGVPETRRRHHCWFDCVSGRFVLQGKELHCGDCFQVRIGSDWHDVRIEMTGDRWYLYGLPSGNCTDPSGYDARQYPGQV